MLLAVEAVEGAEAGTVVPAVEECQWGVEEGFFPAACRCFPRSATTVVLGARRQQPRESPIVCDCTFPTKLFSFLFYYSFFFYFSLFFFFFFLSYCMHERVMYKLMYG